MEGHMAKTKPAALSTPTRGQLSGELALGAILAELLGTFILTLVVLNTEGSPIIAALGVLILVLVFSKLSGGHINPAVTVAMWATKQIGWLKALSYLIAQVLGAMLAVVVMNQMIAGAVGPTGEPRQLFTLFNEAIGRGPGEWQPIFGELVGAILFGLGVGAVALGKKEGFEAAFTIGGALLLGLVAAISASYGVLNPAVALGVGGYAAGGIWSFAAYGLAPIVGATIGALLYKLLQSDIALGVKKS